MENLENEIKTVTPIESTHHKNVPNDKEIQLYYYMITNQLKNYKLYSLHPYLYPSYIACESCYGLKHKDLPYYVHNIKNSITLCQECYDNNKSKYNYNKVEEEMDPGTGLYTYKVKRSS